VKRSVEKISKLEFSILLPGHGKPINEDASKKLKEFVANGFKMNVRGSVTPRPAARGSAGA
jgi:hypothetical protein